MSLGLEEILLNTASFGSFSEVCEIESELRTLGPLISRS
jgi:hypothetical protein